MLKRMFSFLLALTLCLSLAACGNEPEPGNGTAAAEGTAPEAFESEVSETVPETKKAEAAEIPTEPQNAEVSEALPETETGEEPEALPEPQNAEPAYDYVPEPRETDTLTWNFDAAAGTLFVHGAGAMRDYYGAAPEWEQYRDQIRKVSLDDGITSVGAYAFYNYPNLAEARLPDSVEVIGDSAFDYNWALRTVTIPASLKYVGSRAFYNTLLWEPSDLVFPEGCEYIGDQAFHSALKSGGIVSLPSTLKYLGAQSFTNAWLSDFIVAENNGIYRSENHAIYTKDGKEMRMLAPVAAITGEFRIPDGVETISAECFNLIQNIETVTIPASVTEIEEGAFFSTFALKEIVVDEANPNYRSENGLLLSKDGKLLLAWPDGMGGSELVIPEGVERIGAYLFYGHNDGSFSVVLPESVKEIGTMSLPGCMTSLTLPAGLEKIDASVFYNGISVDSITYNGTAADWEKITIEDGNAALDNAAIRMN